ncbi:MAG: DUF2812 domain-containing protein [Emergencia sp.]
MNYRLEVWKYSIVNAMEAQRYLNQRSEEGWEFWNLMTWPGIICFRRRREGDARKIYAIDVFYDREGERWIEEAEYLSFFKDVGWSYVTRLGNPQLRLFEQEWKPDIKEIYEDEDAPRRAALSISRKPGLGLFAVCLLMLAVFIWWSSPLGIGMVFILLLIFAMPLLPGLLAEAADTMYLRGCGGDGLRRFVKTEKTVCMGILFFIYVLSSLLAWKMFLSGDFRNLEEIWIIPGAAFISLLSLPLLLLGTAAGCIGRSNTARITETILCVLSYVGMIWGLALPLM